MPCDPATRSGNTAARRSMVSRRYPEGPLRAADGERLPLRFSTKGTSRSPRRSKTRERANRPPRSSGRDHRHPLGRLGALTVVNLA